MTGTWSKPAARASLALVAVVFFPHVRSLWGRVHGDTVAKLCVQAALLFYLKWRGQDVVVSAAIPPAATIFTMIASFLSSRMGQEAWGRSMLQTVVCASMIPSLREACDSLEGQDVIAMVAVQLGLLLEQNQASSVIVLMLTGGEALEEYAMEEAGKELNSLLLKGPKLAHRLDSVDSPESVDIDVNNVKMGDHLLVRDGELVPTDGCLVSDQALLDESLVTGESTGKRARKGDSLLAGSLNSSSTPFIMVAQKECQKSTLQLMKNSLSQALEAKSAYERHTFEVAELFTPFTIVVSSLSFILQSQLHSPAVAWETALSVFMSATPCPLQIGVPVSFLSAMNLSSRNGVTFKSGAALEGLATGTLCVLDKTGTLTHGEPRVTHVERLASCPSSISKQRLIQLVYSLEETSGHVLAEAIRNYAKDLGVSVLRSVNVQVHPEGGISGSVQGIDVKVGSRTFIETSCGGPSFPSTMDSVEGGHSLSCYIALNNVYAGYILLKDEIREQSHQLVQDLKREGLKVAILSGDQGGNLKSVAEALGVDEYHSCLPHEKADYIKKQIQSGEKVLMVGDGVNDAPALATATVGISVGLSDLASESANVVIMNNDVSKIVWMIKLAKHALSVARLGVHVGMAVSTMQMMVAGIGGPNVPPFYNACAQEMVDLGVVFNSMRVMYYSSK